MLPWLSLVALIAVGLLGWNLYRRFGADRLDAFSEKRRSTSQLVGRGEFVDGKRHLDVALALTPSTLFYENADMQASVDLKWVQEIEYDNELTTGQMVPDGKVLRLRCHSQTFEFLLHPNAVASWRMMLPPRVMEQAAHA